VGGDVNRSAWDPAQYARYSDARTRPARELIARIPDRSYKTIVDLGCGDGPVTALLVERWPTAQITGIDSSEAMLAKARETCPSVTFVECDVATWESAEPSDLIFSNATLQWIDRHDTLLPKLARMLAPGGVLAIQMPGNFDAPSHRLLAALATSPNWNARTGHLVRHTPVQPPSYYVDLLAPLTSRIEAWETTDLLMLDGDNAVLEWMKGTALRPFLTALPPSDAVLFQQQLAERLSAAYPRRPSGKTLFPFRRIYFVVAR
jgi:trans-aconitate 2-methyltransferase